VKSLSRRDLLCEIEAAENALDELGVRERRLWDRIKIVPTEWSQSQYPGLGPFWVIACMGRRCLYFNSVESGWGWGRFDTWGQICEYHWQDLEIQHVVSQTLFGIDEGGLG